MNILQAQNIVKSFGNLKVLKGVSLNVEKGEILAITGASGAGKTTLLQVLGTLSTPDSGSLSIEGKDIFSLSPKALSAFRGKNVGFVFQSHNLLPEFTALENVMIPALIAGVSSSRAKENALRLLGSVGLSERLSHKSSELSGGEQQRVAIARSLINNPAVVFADEPTGNLDSVTGGEIQSLFFSLREQFSQTIIIVTHDNSLASHCDRMVTMVDGQII